MPYFSIIIPVYNVAPYLCECLDSVLAQTFTNWEAICVDDGSTDGSGAILDEYAAKDKRFRVFHQPNAGVSAARNMGLDNIHGEYFGFIDPDDILKCDYIEHLLSLVTGRPNWIGVIGWCEFYSDDIKTAKPQKMGACDGFHPSSNPGVFFQCGAMWNKVYPSELLKSNSDIRFADGLYIGEDMVFIATIAALSEGFVVDGKYNGYYYRIRERSLCHGRSPYEMTKCYWQDVLALARSKVACDRPRLIGEFIVRCVAGHMFDVRGICDVLRLVRQMHIDGIKIWGLVSEFEKDNLEARRKAWKYPLAVQYAKVLGSRMPLIFQAGAILMFSVNTALVMRSKRICNRFSKRK